MYFSLLLSAGPAAQRLTLGLQVKHSIISVRCLQEQCPLFHLCCSCKTCVTCVEVLNFKRKEKEEEKKGRKKRPNVFFRLAFPHIDGLLCQWPLCESVLHVGLYSKCWERAGAWLTQLTKRRSLGENGWVLHTKFEVALLSLIQNVCPNYCEWTVRRASVVRSIAVKCRISTEPRGKSSVCWLLCCWEGSFFFLLHARQSNPASPQGSSEEGGLLIMIIIW